MAVFKHLILLVFITQNAKSAPTDTIKLSEINNKALEKGEVIYESKFNITKIIIPLNKVNFDTSSEEKDSDRDQPIIFFVETDTTDDKNIGKGLSVLIDGVATKVLPNGRDARMGDIKTKVIYLAADDGLYTYNEKANKAEKYGTFNDDLISVVTTIKSGEPSASKLYVLTKDNILYEVTDNGSVKTKVDEVKNAKEIVADYVGNLFYIDDKNDVYIYNGTDVTKIENLPQQISYTKLIRPSFLVPDQTYIVIDERPYVLYGNGSVDTTNFLLKIRPTAHALDVGLLQYYAYDKKIYQYNFLNEIFNGIFKAMKGWIKDSAKSVKSLQKMATKSLSSF